MSAFTALNTGLYSTLSGGTALTTLLGGTAVYYLHAPEGASLPYVVWNYQGGGDENQTPSRMKNLLLFIRGYAATPSLAGSIDTQVDALLHGQTLTVSGWTNFWTNREEDLALVEYEPTGENIYMAGGMYRVRLT